MAFSSVSLSRTYSSFSGCDIRVVIEGETLGQAQAVSYAIQREKAPIYVMGRVDPLSFSRGKRGIAGTIITLMFDRHVLFTNVFRDRKFIADKDEIYASVDNFAGLRNVTANQQALNLVGQDVANPNDFTLNPQNVTDNYQLNQAWYLDQLPPFDIVLIAVNEYGNAATMRIYGAELLNEGSGFSIDDMMIENQATYICRTILPWQPMGSFDMTTPNVFNDPEVLTPNVRSF